MNYLAHLYLAQPNADSHFGNLLGDFGGHRHTHGLSNAVKRGLANHYLVDKFTDNHPAIKDAKHYFTAKRKRFAGIAIDVVFDHFLIAHWRDFHSEPLTQFKRKSYFLLNERRAAMPAHMQRVVTSLTQHDWFKEYESLEGVGIALDNIARRIRFPNEFAGAVNDIRQHYNGLNAVFLDFFPQLISHVRRSGLEISNR
ncbi:ACP phosphodiesterase [Alteromonas ponticola]|uniref:DUF479 domain-containing protein n=1 Tax=Alteromonas ponticola TaxID=2720613 RepID=A0ABX1R5Z4_9ALTE|nr:ACP phosphodiesterase [Alteromonas ponticola]NMH61346.1 DUF479 domain-containing protein [Alteromonas ponticola]